MPPSLVSRRRPTGLRRRRRAGMLALGLLHGAAQANIEANFDTSMLFRPPNAEAIDVSRFRHGNPTPAGRYVADVSLNGEPLGRMELLFTEINGNGGAAAALCLSQALLERLDLSPEALEPPMPRAAAGCERLATRIPAMRAHFDLSVLHLHLEIPQALRMQRPRGYISPTRWQNGVPVAFLHYDANHHHYRNPRHQSQYSYLGLRGGINLGGWALRHRGALQWQSQGTRRYQRIDTYIERDLPALQGQLTLGDFQTSNHLLEGMGLRGLRLVSDERMLPSSRQGYAPIVRGIADSAARLEIRQNGNLIHATTVPAGPFVIDDLYPSGYGGDLEVTLIEANGRVRVFTVPFASVIELVRPGHLRYQFAAGRYREAGHQFDEWVAQSSLQYGLRNDLTLNAGLTSATRYRAGLLGAAVNTPIGAFAADITLAQATLRRENRRASGHSLHLSYHTVVPHSGTYLSLAAYRYSSHDFYTLRDTLWRNRDPLIDGVTGHWDSLRRPRNRLKLSINQYLPGRRGSLSLSGSTEDDWRRSGRRHEYQASYYQQYRQLGYQLGYSQTRDPGVGHRDHRIYLSLSIPLGQGIGRPLWSGSLSRQAGGGYSAQSSISGVTGARGEFSYGLSASAQSHGQANYSINGGWRAPFARLNASASLGADGHQQFSAGASGAIVAHPAGLTFGNELGETFAIVHAPGAAGVPIRQTQNHRLDRNGMGLVPYLLPYQMNRIALETDGLSLDIGLSASEQEVVPRANHALLVRFETEVGTSRLFRLTLPDGSVPPITAEALDQDGRFVGHVAQAGLLFTRGLAPRGALTLTWSNGNGKDRHCRADYDASNLPPSRDGALPPALALRCEPVA